MAKVKGDKKLYKRMRASGLRKRAARDLAHLPRIGSDGKRAPKAARQAIEQLRTVVAELESHASRGERKAAARKAARTRKRDEARRSSSARKAAKTRAAT
jgi:hypothetical protein